MLLVFSPYVEKIEMGDIFEIIDQGAHEGRGLVVQVLDFWLPSATDVSVLEYIDWELREMIADAAEKQDAIPQAEDMARSFQIAVAQVIAERAKEGGEISEWRRWLPTPGSEAKPLGAEGFREVLKELVKRDPQDFQLVVGEELASELDIELSVDDYFKGHLAVFGMTRSGKSVFALNLIVEGVDRDPSARFVVFDIRNEYAPVLKKHFGKQVLIRKAREYINPMTFRTDQVASFLGLGSTKTDTVVAYEITKRLRNGTLTDSRGKIAFDGIRTEVETIKRIGGDAALLVNNPDVRKKLSAMVELCQDAQDIIDDVNQHPIVVITHPERSVNYLQRSAAIILETILDHAFKTKGEDFACQIVFEEAHYYVPETNAPRFGDPRGTEVYDKLIEALSQAGGYNVGITLICQRPTYVAKSALSQCNTLINFRVKTQGDQEQLASASEYMTTTILNAIAGLPNHTFILTGLASPARFPLIVVSKPHIFTAKAGKTASEVLQEMSGTTDLDQTLAKRIQSKRQKSKKRK